MSWRPVLHGADADRARALVAAIVDELARREITDATLADGHAGIALLHGYRARAGDPEAAELAFAALAQALDGVSAVPWLFRGYAGIGFAIQHLGAIAGDASEALAALDGLVARHLAVDAWPHDWELCSGAIGLGVYALERGDAAGVARVVHHLAARVEPDGSWRAFDPGEPTGYFELGLAHGIAGAVAFLAGALAAPGARALLAGAVAWLLRRERTAAVPAYPMTEARRVELHTGLVDGWCHGDASTALALVRAGHAAGEPAWLAAGHATATRAARRSEAELATVAIEGGLCHGEIGRALLFHRLGLALGDDELLAAARRAYARTALVADSGLQTGLAGVALGLLSGSTDVAPDWDRALLLR